MAAAGNVVSPYLDRITQVPRSFVDQGADLFVRIAERTGGHMMGKRLSARTSGLSASAEGAQISIVGTPASLWALREDGARQHRIAPRRGGVLAGGLGHPVGTPVRHPGFAGQHLWTNTVRQAEAEIDRLAESMADRAAA